MKNQNTIMPTQLDNEIVLYSEDFLNRIQQLKDDMHKLYTSIGEEETPKFDASGRKIVDKRPDGKDYIIEAYMRKKLDQYFPGWTLEMAAPLHFLAAEWVVAQVNLIIIDEKLLAFGIVPPVRKFYGVDSVRIQYRKDTAHNNPDNIIYVGDNCKQAVSAAFKYAINRLTNIGDDVYAKRMDLEGAGSIDTIINSDITPDNIIYDMFCAYIKGKRPSEIFKILGIKTLNDIIDYRNAYNKLKNHYEGGE
jgi:hypothetical protein